MRVVVFTGPGCSWCKKVKDYLKRNHVSFKEVDVSRSASAQKDIIRMTGQMGVPVVLIGSRTVVGFNKTKIDKLLGLRRQA